MSKCINFKDIKNIDTDILLKYKKEIIKMIHKREETENFTFMSIENKVRYMNEYLAKKGISENIRFSDNNIIRSNFYGIVYNEKLVDRDYLDEIIFNKKVMASLKLADEIQTYTNGSVKLCWIDPEKFHEYNTMFIMNDSDKRRYEIHINDINDQLQIKRLCLYLNDFLDYKPEDSALIYRRYKDNLAGVAIMNEVYLQDKVIINKNTPSKLIKIIDQEIFEMKENLKKSIDNI